MCGRFTLRAAPAALVAAVPGLRLPADDLPPRYNLAASRKCLIVRDTYAGRQGSLATWGFLPGFIANARSGRRV